MKHRDILWYDADGVAQALLRDVRYVLAIEENLSTLDIVETLQQCEQCRLAAAGMTDKADSLAGHQVKQEILENLLAVRISEIDMVELHAGATPNKWLSFGMIFQFVWY
jgi:hypothetical protein